MHRSTLIALLALTMAGHVASQQPPAPIPAAVDEDEYYPGTVPLERKSLAKDKFEAMQTNLKELAQAKYEAARDAFESRNREFVAGRGTLDFLIEATEHLREAELGIAENGDQRLAAFERCWAVLRQTEKINIARHEAGRIPIQDMAQSTYARLDAEIQWAEERARQKQK